MTEQPQQFAPDTNIFDKIIADDVCLELVRRLTAAGKIELVVTHIQEDELAAIQDDAKRQRMADVPRSFAPTSDFVLGVSRLGMARLGTGALLEPIRATNWSKYTRDGLIAATAQTEGQILVTEERRLQNRAKELGIPTWDWVKFNRYLRTLDT